jgi:hypothetical protein
MKNIPLRQIVQFEVMGKFELQASDCPPESGERDREADHARGGSRVTT